MSQLPIQRGRPATLLRSATIVRLLFVVCGVIAAALGLLFWADTARGLLSLHVLAGLVVTVTLAALALLAWTARVNRGLIAIALGCCVLLPLLGFAQARLLPGAAHWFVEVVHLLVGIGAMVLGQRLMAQIRRALGE